MLVSLSHTFSFIIPSFLLCLGSGIFWVGRTKKIAPYIYSFALVIMMAGVLQIAQAIAIPQQMLHVLPWLCVWFLCMMSLIAHSIYLRFKLHTRWPYIALIIALSIPFFLYFTYINYSLEYRLIVLTFATSLIFANDFKGFLSQRSKHWLDHWLKMVVASKFVVLGGQVLFLILMSSTDVLDNYLSIFWSLTQFTILFFSMAIFSLLSGCAVHDSMRTLKHERNIDPLTGLFNRRILHEQARLFHALPHAPYALLLCDLDHFKKINDQYGHAVGDLALQHVSQIMRTTLCHRDRLIRFGGEEFLVVLSAESLTAVKTAERLRHHIECQPLYLPEHHIQLTMSIGLSFFNQASELETALQDADLLLYQAKKLGRNQIAWQLEP